MTPEHFIRYMRRRCVEKQREVKHGPWSKEAGYNEALHDIGLEIDVYLENHLPKENDNESRTA